MFDDDIGPQAKRTMAAVKTAVDGLGSLDVVGPFLVRLGARHVRYGVRTEHFDVVGAALLWTLEQGLGERFTPAVRDAWVGRLGRHRRSHAGRHEPAEAALDPEPALDAGLSGRSIAVDRRATGLLRRSRSAACRHHVSATRL